MCDGCRVGNVHGNRAGHAAVMKGIKSRVRADAFARSHAERLHLSDSLYRWAVYSRSQKERTAGVGEIGLVGMVRALLTTCRQKEEAGGA
jgi:hypothetical protein